MKGWDDVKGFKVVSKGWMVEPTFAGLDRYRRWSKGSEYLVGTMVSVSSVVILEGREWGTSSGN